MKWILNLFRRRLCRVCGCEFPRFYRRPCLFCKMVDSVPQMPPVRMPSVSRKEALFTQGDVDIAVEIDRSGRPEQVHQGPVGDRINENLDAEAGARAAKSFAESMTPDHPYTNYVPSHGPYDGSGGMMAGCAAVGSGTWRLYDHLMANRPLRCVPRYESGRLVDAPMVPFTEEDVVMAVRGWYPTFDPKTMTRPGEEKPLPLTPRTRTI